MQAIFETLFDAVYLTTVITLGIGKLITSITMMLFYVLLYYVWRCRYEINDRKGLTALWYSSPIRCRRWGC